MTRDKSGFSTFELGMTIAIMAIIATFVMPPYLEWLRTYRLNGAVNSLVSDIELAKVRAIRENDMVAVLFQPTSYTMFVDNGEGGGTADDWVCNGSEEIVRDRDMPAGVSIDISAMTLSNNRVRFNGRGLPPDVFADEDISLKNEHGAKTVVLNRLGHLELN